MIKRISYVITNAKRAGINILSKIHFKARNIIKYKEVYFIMIKRLT